MCCALPQVDVAVDARPRPVVSVTTAPSGFEGEGFPVRRAFAGVDLADLDPFVHMDQMGEVEYAPGEPKGTSWHPHRGFETVTYIIDGTFQHRDSAGGGGLITNGDTQWMTAGGGILHIERPPEEMVAAGGLFHGIQLWVNLPAAQKWVEPRYQDIRAGEVTLLRSPDGGAHGPGHRRRGRRATPGPGITYTPIALTHVTVSPGARFELPVADPSSTPWPTCWPAGARSARAGRRCARASWPCSAPATAWCSTADAHPGQPHARRSRCWCSAAGPSASRWPPTGRSS